MDPLAAENPNKIESEALAYIFKNNRDAFPAKPYNEDGNPEMYTTSNKEKRAALRNNPIVIEAIEKFSVVKTLQAIESANVVLLLLDATQGVTDQDAHIAGFVLESGRAVVLAINKWDAVDAYQRELVHRSIEARLAFLKFAAKKQFKNPFCFLIVKFFNSNF